MRHKSDISRHKNRIAPLLCLLLALTLSLAACSGGSGNSSTSGATDSTADPTTSSAADSPAGTSSGRSLVEHGMDLVALIQDMVTDDVYATIYMGSSQAVSDEIAKLAEGDYSTPEAVYKVTVPNLAAFLDATITASGAQDTLSDSLKEYMQSRLILTVSSMVNNAYGSAAIAAASICTATKTFASAELTENMIYVYTFETAHPILITFFQGEDATVSATAIPLFTELPASSAAEDVKALFGNKGFEIVVEKVDYKP